MPPAWFLGNEITSKGQPIFPEKQIVERRWCRGTYQEIAMRRFNLSKTHLKQMTCGAFFVRSSSLENNVKQIAEICGEEYPNQVYLFDHTLSIPIQNGFLTVPTLSTIPTDKQRLHTAVLIMAWHGIPVHGGLEQQKLILKQLVELQNKCAVKILMIFPRSIWSRVRRGEFLIEILKMSENQHFYESEYEGKEEKRKINRRSKMELKLLWAKINNYLASKSPHVRPMLRSLKISASTFYRLKKMAPHFS